MSLERGSYPAEVWVAPLVLQRLDQHGEQRSLGSCVRCIGLIHSAAGFFERDGWAQVGRSLIGAGIDDHLQCGAPEEWQRGAVGLLLSRRQENPAANKTSNNQTPSTASRAARSRHACMHLRQSGQCSRHGL